MNKTRLRIIHRKLFLKAQAVRILIDEGDLKGAKSELKKIFQLLLED